MADPEKVEYVPPAEYQIKSPLDLASIKPGGVGTHPEVSQSLEAAKKAQLEYAQALEDRFAQPNWFRIAAGFAKPQLGGFLASVGSASEELGRQQEARRAIAPSIARMRTETAVGQFGLSQKMAQKEMWDQMNAGKIPLTADTVRKLGEYGTDTDIYKAAKQKFDTEQTAAGTKRTQVGTQIEAQTAAAEKPYLVLDDPIFKGTVADRSPEQVQQSMQNLQLAKPKDIPDEKWNAMSIADKLDTVAKYSNEAVAQGLNEEQKSAATARVSNNLLNELTYLRTLASDEKLAPVFSLFKNGDAFSMLKSYLEKNQGDMHGAVEGLTAAAMENLKNADPETRQKADKLIKSIARLEVNLRGTNVNPTDAFQNLNQQASPSLMNSQSGFLGILDQMGMQAKHDIDRHNLRIDSNIPARRIMTDTADFENQYRDELERLAKSNPFDVTPPWFKPKGTPRSQGAGSSGGASGEKTMLQRLREEKEARARANQP